MIRKIKQEDLLHEPTKFITQKERIKYYSKKAKEIKL